MEMSLYTWKLFFVQSEYIGHNFSECRVVQISFWSYIKQNSQNSSCLPVAD